MMLAGGVALSAGGLVLGRAAQAVAATPVSGGCAQGGRAGRPPPPIRSTRPRHRSPPTMSAAAPSIIASPSSTKAGAPQMELAEAIESKDAKTWTVKLKKRRHLP